MTAASAYRHAYRVCACALFIFLAQSLTHIGGDGAVSDTDPLWHIAAGDLIRAQGAIPAGDPWSFTAGDYRWLNISWAWDSVMSFVREQLGWHGAAAISAITIALALTLIFLHCLQRSDDLITSLTVMLAVMLGFSFFLRPLQITHLFVAAWMLTLGNVARGTWDGKWLALLPLSMLLWVNAHGGFVVGAVLLSAFFAQALYQKHSALARRLGIAGLFCAAAMLCNPYGLSIIEAVWRPMTSAANPLILEWQPVSASGPGLQMSALAIIFLLLVPRNRALPILPCERWLAYFWLLMGLSSMRHMPVFAAVAAPIAACALRPYLVRDKATPHPAVARAWNRLLDLGNRRASARLALFAAVALALWLPSPPAARHYGQEQIKIPSLAQEIRFLRQQYPRARLVTHFNLASLLVYETRGGIPVFADPRNETALPPEAMRDYIAFEKGEKDWEDVLERHAIDGVMLPVPGPLSKPALLDRFEHRRGWKKVYTGPAAAIFMREHQ